MNRFWLVLAGLYCAGIFWLSSGPNPLPMQDLFDFQDKVEHMTLYGGLTLFVGLGLWRNGKSPWRRFLVPVIFVSLYGASDEIHQYFVPGRSCDLGDWAADTVGAVLWQTVLFWFLTKREARRAPKQRPSPDMSAG